MDNTESDFFDRLLVERDELSKKIGKLCRFLNAEKFSKISPQQKALLDLQIGHMKNYASCLKLRIEESRY